jgi:hypothetical protein
MQKVVGSSPIIRFQKAPLGGFLLSVGSVASESVAREVEWQSRRPTRGLAAEAAAGGAPQAWNG